MAQNATDLTDLQAQVLQGLLLARDFGEVHSLTSKTTGRPDGIVGPGTLAALDQARTTLGTGGAAGTVDANLITALLAQP